MDKTAVPTPEVESVQNARNVDRSGATWVIQGPDGSPVPVSRIDEDEFEIVIPAPTTGQEADEG